MKREWIRLYTKVPHDPKVQSLPGPLFKFWINLLCLAGAEGGKRVPNSHHIAWVTHLSESHVEKLLQLLNKSQLIVRQTPTENDSFDGYVIHDWEEYQYDSDFSRERMQRFRDRHRDVTVTDKQSRREAEQQQQAAAARREESVPASPERQLPPAAAPPGLAQIIPFAAAACHAAEPALRSKAEKALLKRYDDIRNADNPEGLALTILKDFGISPPPRQKKRSTNAKGGDDYDELAAEIARRKHVGA